MGEKPGSRPGGSARFGGCDLSHKVGVVLVMSAVLDCIRLQRKSEQNKKVQWTESLSLVNLPYNPHGFSA